jgi:hypothetical protein
MQAAEKVDFGPVWASASRRGFSDTAGGIKVFLRLFCPSLEVFAFAFVFAFASAFVLVCQIHLGLLYALMVSCFWLGACWGPMVMNRGCYLKPGL